MLSYYSYYSVGGYKDLYLGSNAGKEKATYYLPLLPVLEERAKNDAEAARQAAELKQLPAISQLSVENAYGLPNAAKVLFSHAGYKLIYKHLEGDKYALALRDIPNRTKDETGRSIPFLFVIMGDSAADVKKLDILAAYMASNIRSVEAQIAQCLYMDFECNGLRFDLAGFNAWISGIISKNPSATLVGINDVIKVHASHNRVALLLLPGGITLQKAVTEQRINTENIVSMKVSDVISKDEPEKLVEQLMMVVHELKAERKKNDLMKKCAVASGVGGVILGAIIAGMASK